jgi:hypothetical protein
VGERRSATSLAFHLQEQLLTNRVAFEKSNRLNEVEGEPVKPFTLGFLQYGPLFPGQATARCIKANSFSPIFQLQRASLNSASSASGSKSGEKMPEKSSDAPETGSPLDSIVLDNTIRKCPNLGISKNQFIARFPGRRPSQEHCKLDSFFAALEAAATANTTVTVLA